jgi:protein-tyrosine-phosphatase
MAEAMLAVRLTALGAEVKVRSAGTLLDGEPPLPEVIIAMEGYGLDVTTHRSHRVTPEDLERADLTIAMAREHLRYAVVMAPSVWPRAFTLRELVRRGATIGSRGPGESLSGWLARAHAGRERNALLGDSAEDDVADPIGGPQRGYTETAQILHQLIDRVARLGWPVDSVPGYSV